MTLADYRDAGPRGVGTLPGPRTLVARDPRTRCKRHREYRRYDVIDEMASRGLFREVGRRTTAPVEFAQSIDDYVESFHSRNGLSRQRMSAVSQAAFDAAVRQLVQPCCPDGIVRRGIIAHVVWGAPAVASPRAVCADGS